MRVQTFSLFEKFHTRNGYFTFDNFLRLRRRSNFYYPASSSGNTETPSVIRIYWA